SEVRGVAPNFLDDRRVFDLFYGNKRGTRISAQRSPRRSADPFRKDHFRKLATYTSISPIPFNIVRCGSNSCRSRVSCHVASDTATPPGGATPCNRLAMFIVSPQ